MLDIKYIRENVGEVKKNCKNRGVKVDLDQLLKLDDQRREVLQKIEDLRSQRNLHSKTKPSKEQMKELKAMGEKIKEYESELQLIESDYNDLLLRVPNMTHPDSPVGKEKDYSVIETVGRPKDFEFEPKDHEDLLTNLGQLDFKRGAKVTGTKFYFSLDKLVRLNRALVDYGIDIVTSHGYSLLETPDLVKKEVMDGSGFNPRGEESQIYQIDGHDLSLIGTSEITVLGFHANETLDLSAGPVKYAALSHCFRTEAGAYGKASRGLYRVHQFTKLELFVFCNKNESEELHKEILDIEKEIIGGLELPYRVIDIPTGDLGGPAYKKYDVEVWMPMLGENGDYGEITSCSNCTDYQSRRLGIKYADSSGKKEFIHTLNGTAIVSSRFPIAIAENYQNKDGSISIPKVLRDYIGVDNIN